MERQTKHRILGTLVVLGLIVITLPFFQTSNELPSETALVKAPAFPDQAVQVSSSDSISNDLTPPASAPAPAPAATTEATASQTATTATPEATSIGPTTQPDDTINLNQPPASAATPAPVMPNPAAEPTDKSTTPGLQPESSETQQAPAKQDATKPKADDTSAKHTPSVRTSKLVDAAKHTKSSSHATSKMASTSPSKTTNRHRTISGYQVVDPSEVEPADEAGFVRLKSAGWAIQVGTFKNKTNALRLVNSLRKKGYSSFIQQAGTSKMTRVLIGPEYKQGSAKALALKLATEAHLHAVVVSYKPLVM